MERKPNSIGISARYPGEIELKEIDVNEENLKGADFVSGNEQSNKFISFSVKLTDRNLGFTIQEDVLGLDEGLFVGAVDRNGPLSSSQIISLFSSSLLLFSSIKQHLNTVYYRRIQHTFIDKSVV